MAKNYTIYPQAILVGSTWSYVLEVGDEEFLHIVGASIVTERELVLLKVVLELDVDDASGPADIDAALFVDDIRPGPQTGTVWEGWQAIAEGIISGLSVGYTERDFWAAWNGGDTQAVRNAVNRALVSGPGGIGRGWTILGFHQHEGDGSVTETGI